MGQAMNALNWRVNGSLCVFMGTTTTAIGAALGPLSTVALGLGGVVAGVALLWLAPCRGEARSA